MRMTSASQIDRRQSIEGEIDRRRSIEGEIDRWWSIEGEIDRRQLIEGEIDRQRSIEEEKGKRKKKKKEEEEKYLARAPSPPAGRPRVVAALAPHGRLFSPRGERDRGDAQGDKNIIKFEGDHNSSRPQFYYDSVSIFFYNVLQPPQIPSSCTSNFQRYYDLGELKAGAGTDEVISCIFLLETNYGRKKKKILVKEIILDFLVDEDNMITNMGGNSVNESNLQVTHFVSYSSSILLFQMTLRALATPLRRIQRKSSAKPKNKKKGTVVSKKPKREKLEKGETLSQRLRLCILGRANHRRHRST
ncbi:hypothetical protein BHE74_00001241 [Ensete ventricosum]|nr:hypothetical protein BHE74_00001241 [Ensete ventricosum]